MAGSLVSNSWITWQHYQFSHYLLLLHLSVKNCFPGEVSDKANTHKCMCKCMQDTRNTTLTQKSTVQKIQVRCWKLNIVTSVCHSIWANKPHLWAGLCSIAAAQLCSSSSFSNPGGGSLSRTSRQHFVRTGGTASHVTTLEVRLLLLSCGLSGSLRADCMSWCSLGSYLLAAYASKTSC